MPPLPRRLPTDSTPTVLVVDDEHGIREGLAVALRRHNWDAVPVPSLGAARVTLSHRAVDCILLDVRLKDGDGLEFLRELKAGNWRDIPVIVATAYGDGERTIAAMRDGAFDYLTKPFDLEALLESVRRALDSRRAKLHPLEEPSETLIGRSAPMQEVWKRIGRAAAGHDPVLVRGERGSGKETVARALHLFSRAPERAFVHDRAAGLEPSQVLARCREEVTWMLDEVVELTPPAAHALADALHEGTVARVVATASVQPAAGQPPLDLDQGLYFQLAVVEIDVPPLRARKSDIPLLVAHALRDLTTRAVSEAAMSRLLAHDWPGNVGELISVLRRAAALASSDVIDERHLPDDLGTSQTPTAHNPYLGLPLRAAVTNLERDLLLAALERADGNRTVAAKLLGVARPQLYAKLGEHGLENYRRER